MGGEVYNFLLDWTIAIASLVYSHGVGMFIAQGATRFLLLFPVIFLFLFLPLNLTTIIFAGPTSFFLSWLATFKLTLFAFNQGPLSSNPPLPLSHFIATCCLPINITQKTPKKTTKKLHIDRAPEILLLFVVIKAYGYRDELRFHPLLTMACISYCFLFMIGVFFAVAATVVRALLGVELEPQFGKPQYSTSVQDFWGRRWNRMVSGMLRAAVYVPARGMFRVLLVPERWVAVPASFMTFIVSGVMHDMLLYYIGQDKPTWEMTLFFVIHGVLVGIEIVVKKKVDLQGFEGSWVVPRVALTWILFVSTSFWLFFPPFFRLDPCSRICKETMAFLGWIKHGHLLDPNEFACPYVFSMC